MTLGYALGQRATMIDPPALVMLWIFEDPHAARAKLLADSTADDKGGAEAANLDAAASASAASASAASTSAVPASRRRSAATS
jgi:hypothetical protein